MPVISYFLGITISMYFGDHAPPHFHVDYQGHEALINIATGEVMKGRLPPTVRRLVSEWLTLHREELFTNFQKVYKYETPSRITGLDE